MAVNPKSGKVYVSNTDAHNDVRFEGHTPGLHVGRRQHGRQPHHGDRPVGESRDVRATSTRTSITLTQHAATRRSAWPSREGIAVSNERKEALRRRAGLEQARRLRRRARSRPGSVTPTAGSQVAPLGRRADGRRRSTKTKAMAYVLTRVRQRHLRRRPGQPKEIAHVHDVQPRAAERDGGTPVPLRRDAHLARSATRRARAATSAATSTAWRGTSATRATSRSPSRHFVEQRVGRADDPEGSCSSAASAGADRRATIFAAYHAAQGADDDAEPARARQPRRDALARRPQRRHPAERRAVPRLRAATRSSRRSRTPASSTRSTRSSRSTSPSRASLGNAAELSDADMTDFTNFVAADHLPAEPDPQPRRLAHRRAAGAGARSIFNQTRRTAASCRRTASTTATAATCSIATRNAGATRAPGLLRDRRPALVRGRDADLQGPPPPQRVPEDRHVRVVARAVARARCPSSRSSTDSPRTAAPFRPCAASGTSTRRRGRHGRAVLHRPRLRPGGERLRRRGHADRAESHRHPVLQRPDGSARLRPSGVSIQGVAASPGARRRTSSRSTPTCSPSSASR